MGGKPSAALRDRFAGLIEGWEPGFARAAQEDQERILASM